MMHRAWRFVLRASPLSALLWLQACAAPAPDTALARTTRFVSSPSSIAALSQAADAPGLPPQLSFGGAQGRCALFLKFELPAHSLPLRAYIALSPREGAPIDGAPVTLEAWRVSSPWQSEQLVSWSDKPDLAPPHARAVVESSSATAQRIDVTELVRFAAQHPEMAHGIALLGRSGSGPGATFATGLDGGLAPRLELYAR